MEHTGSKALMSVVHQALREADALRHDYIGTGHLLAALLRDNDGRAAKVLAMLGVDCDTARTRILSAMQPGALTAPMGERPYTSRARRALERSIASADEFMESDLDTDHLLIGLLSVEEGLAAQALAVDGITVDAVASAMQRIRE
jgi:ATP-dependent Clp protease ATP-binding subunit ClpC